MNRREFATCVPFFVLRGAIRAAEQSGHQATGVKVGEVSESSATVWMRVTEAAERRADGIVRQGRPQPIGSDVKTRELNGSCPGAHGRVRVRYSTRQDLKNAVETPWVDVAAATDYTHQFRLSGLKPATRYYYAAETGEPNRNVTHPALRGTFQTAPEQEAAADIRFALMTCQKYSQLDHADGFHIYESMLKARPDFYITAGDIVYYDSDDPKATTSELAHYHWERMYSFPRHKRLLQAVPGYWEKDDHDTLTDDVWPSKEVVQPLSFQEGLRIFRQQVPMGDSTFRTFRWGRTAQIWLVEGRDFRSANTMPDGPEKTIWGAPQKDWLKRTMLESDADWKILVSPTPIVGPDRTNKHDNHSNDVFRHEGDEMREWFRKNAGDRFVNINGDRHWQYHSVHPDAQIHEFSAGAASDSHASGSPGEDPKFHRFHRVKGGFLTLQALRSRGRTSLTARHHDVFGAVVYEHTFERSI
jgi:alkaline phosphatase D